MITKDIPPYTVWFGNPAKHQGYVTKEGVLLDINYKDKEGNTHILDFIMIKFLDLQKITAKYADEIHEAVNRVVDSGWYLQGSENERFEANYSAYIGTKYTIGCANGLDALIWIFRAYIEMGIMKPGDEVIVPANTYIASILAISENGLKPVLVEPDITTYQIDENKNRSSYNRTH